MSGTDTLTAAGSASVKLRLQHHFKAHDITFTGSASGAKVTSIFFGDRVVWSSSDGIDVSVFGSTSLLRGLLKGQSLRAGLDGAAFRDRYQGQRDTVRAHEFTYPGMVRCGLCGSAMSPYIVKERYIYYRCAGARGPCDAKQVREEALDREFARAIRGLVFPAEWMEYLMVELRKGQAEAQRFHQESIDRLEAECSRVQRRLDTMYVDKLDGVIDADTYTRNARQWPEDLRGHRRAMSRHDEAKRSYLEEGLVILSLAQEAPELFEAATRDEKRELLGHLVSNSTWAAERLTVEWRKPYVFLVDFVGPEEEGPPTEGDSDGGPSKMVGETGIEPATP